MLVLLPPNDPRPRIENTAEMPTELKVQFGEINDRNIETLRKLNEHVFPVHYSPKFYKEVLKAKFREYKLYAYYQGIIVGVICCRVEKSHDKDAAKDDNVLYIMIIGVLPAYRNRGIGKQMLRKILDVASTDKHDNKCKKIYLHVSRLARFVRSACMCVRRSNIQFLVFALRLGIRSLFCSSMHLSFLLRLCDRFPGANEQRAGAKLLQTVRVLCREGN